MVTDNDSAIKLFQKANYGIIDELGKHSAEYRAYIFWTNNKVH